MSKMTTTINYNDWETAYHAWEAMDQLLNAKGYPEVLEAMQGITPDLRDRLLDVVNKLRTVAPAPEEEEPEEEEDADEVEEEEEEPDVRDRQREAPPRGRRPWGGRSGRGGAHRVSTAPPSGDQVIQTRSSHATGMSVRRVRFGAVTRTVAPASSSTR